MACSAVELHRDRPASAVRPEGRPSSEVAVGDRRPASRTGSVRGLASAAERRPEREARLEMAAEAGSASGVHSVDDGELDDDCLRKVSSSVVANVDRC